MKISGLFYASVRSNCEKKLPVNTEWEVLSAMVPVLVLWGRRKYFHLFVKKNTSHGTFFEKLFWKFGAGLLSCRKDSLKARNVCHVYHELRDGKGPFINELNPKEASCKRIDPPARFHSNKFLLMLSVGTIWWRCGMRGNVLCQISYELPGNSFITNSSA